MQRYSGVLLLILVQDTSLETDTLLEMMLKESPLCNLQCHVTPEVTIFSLYLGYHTKFSLLLKFEDILDLCNYFCVMIG